MCYVIGIEVTHTSSDGRAGVHRENYDLGDSMAPFSDSILLISMFSS